MQAHSPGHMGSFYSRLDLFTHKRYSLHRHLGTWLLYWLIFAVSYQNPRSIEPYATYFKIGISLSLFLQAYLNMYWLVPYFLLRNRFSAYLTGLLGMLAIFSMIIGLVSYLMRDFEIRYAPRQLFDPKPAMYFAFALVFVAASSAIKLFQRWILDTHQIGELRQAGVQAELEQLKNQINPHFLFNMLNSANVLIEKDPVKASEVLMSLSDLLRYQLYDSARESVLLTADIGFLKDFLELEKIRRDDFRFKLSHKGHVHGIQIAPFLFITFVENAIKHSHDVDFGSFVEVSFEIRDNELLFNCLNSKPSHFRPALNPGGIGLANVRRRLELLYPHTHSLQINESDTRFEINLSIPI